MILTTSTFTGIIPHVPPPTPQPPTFTLPDPISYEFQVVEYMQDEKITKVALQVKQNTHDQYGNIKIHGVWHDVPRVQVKL
ncbi:hypothetical protein UFOVP240_13 [uncultured Caudovirales phage]|uniref:Uncharacterized protein n=1 Tax=uncultured Caudovirales phage TaxID=2100421 RepID=A0A6J7X055_9CAUD|nr:hypothetical protein UFOVP240_13 [uncultured Caudovirales phage]